MLSAIATKTSLIRAIQSFTVHSWPGLRDSIMPFLIVASSVMQGCLRVSECGRLVRSFACELVNALNEGMNIFAITLSCNEIGDMEVRYEDANSPPSIGSEGGTSSTPTSTDSGLASSAPTTDSSFAPTAPRTRQAPSPLSASTTITNNPAGDQHEYSQLCRRPR